MVKQYGTCQIFTEFAYYLEKNPTLNGLFLYVNIQHLM